MLKKTRTLVAAAALAALALLFLDFTGTLHPWLGWLAKMQLVPAALATNVGLAALIALVLAALLLGRVYCSIVCPLGMMQDCVSRVAGWREGGRGGRVGRFRHKEPMPWLRRGTLALFVIAFAADAGVVVSLLDPYAGFGRVASSFLVPPYRLGNNLLAWLDEAVGGYFFYPVDVWVGGWATFSVAALTLGLVGTLAWRGGRTWCNTVCPVGAFLGLFSRLSLLRTAIDPAKCTKCGLCEKGCKASCIASKDMAVDQGRCVRCFNCVENCKSGAMGYGTAFGKKSGVVAEGDDQVSASRRGVLALLWSMAAAAALKAQQPPPPQEFQPLQAEGGLAKLKPRKIPVRKTPVVPPGAWELHNMEKNCPACQLCVSSCPNGVLRPSVRPAAFMQPEMSFERGYCRPECVECSLQCPTGAIRKVTKAEKAAISIGHVVWDRDRCLVNAENVPCTSCERHCPTEAITLVDRDPGVAGSPKVPLINNELCTGCGACEHYCPARPLAAIHVEGHEKHRIIEFEESDGHGKRRRRQK